MVAAKVFGFRCPVLARVTMGLRGFCGRGRGEVVKRGREGIGMGGGNFVVGDGGTGAEAEGVEGCDGGAGGFGGSGIAVGWVEGRGTLGRGLMGGKDGVGPGEAGGGGTGCWIGFVGRGPDNGIGRGGLVCGWGRCMSGVRVGRLVEGISCGGSCVWRKGKTSSAKST
ncbi:unnamed protein product [Linum trigynum]|uniref:Uncharacterized protein n=1 Tax=Linum trigynum TaxID=586398 RepID=A0AAV2D8Z4_9ROSI